MKTVSKTDSPKTPGGISKSLLTPCRRVGLSRNWKKSGSSPFNLTLSSTPEVKQVEKVEKNTRKRKKSCEETSSSQDVTNTPNSSISQELVSEVSTPVKNVELPRRKKSKTLLSTINNTSDDNEGQNEGNNSNIVENLSGKENALNESVIIENIATESISTPVRLKSKTKIIKKKSPTKKTISNLANNEINENTSEDGQNERAKVKSPNNLTKECIVVIQKKIFKHEINDKDNKQLQNDKKELQNDYQLQQNDNKEQHNTKKSSQTLDSDADDIPLCQLNKPENDTKDTIIPIEDDDDFTITKKIKKHNSKTKPKKINSKTQNTEIKIQNSTQNLIEGDEDDDFFEKKRTIVVKKTYLKPIKAKSTGSITQKDIDDIRARIDKKKKMLLAKTLSNDDTVELRDLIKKWQKGCQEALIQLMDLMKNKMPSNEQMDYSNMLKVLKIPANLVGYDSENDNFVTPDNESIILANISD